MTEKDKIREEILNPTQCEITLDCPPGATRPGNLLPGVLEGTGIKNCKCVSKLFGEWVFRVPKKYTELYIEHEATIIERIKALYHSGQIRYGDWSKP